MPKASTRAPADAPGDRAVDVVVGRALDHLISLQSARGDWEGEMVWNTMILSQLVIVRTICGRPFSAHDRQGILRHLEYWQGEDGAWKMHPESHGYVFFTTLAYVALRLLGVGPDEPMAQRARDWLRKQPGGVLSIPTWGKYWLAFIGLYDYRGTNPVPPEMYLIPSPMNPANFYCHTRNIYMGLAFLHGSRFSFDLGPLSAALQNELYGVPYDSIDFAAHRHDVAASDLYVAPTRAVRGSADAMRLYEKVFSKALRRRALDHCFDQIVFEQRSTRYQALSPVNGLLNCLSLHARDPHHPDLAPSLDGVEAWRWEDEAEGIRYCGARSNTWDTAFAIQTVLSVMDAGDWPVAQRARAGDALLGGYAFLRAVQMVEEVEGYRAAHRDPALGGWCFSDGQHRWPVSDCTAEALSAVLSLHDSGGLAPTAELRISDARLASAGRFILARQNDDGGFGTYERRRGAAFLEHVNNTEMYGACMTERSYIECTASSLAALCHLLRSAPQAAVGSSPEGSHRIESAISRAIAFLRSAQRDDGGYPGFWGVNFTYAIWHVVKALRAAGVPPLDPTLVRAADWLQRHQRSDGGWGEHWTGCLSDSYVEHAESQPVMTAWALLALAETAPHSESASRGAAWLRDHQRPDGSWPAGSVNGVFFGSAMLDYRYYKAYFPTWALAALATAQHPA